MTRVSGPVDAAQLKREITRTLGQMLRAHELSGIASDLVQINGSYYCPLQVLDLADYKQGDSFGYLRGCPRYYGYKDTLQALDIVHSRLLARQSGEDTSRNLSCQRPDALAFPAGSRLNYGVVAVLGAAVRSSYEMILPDHMELVKGRQFARGEGVVLLQGSELHYIKVPVVRNIHRMEEICIKALGGKN